MPLGVSVTLQIEDQDLVESGLSSWTHLILIFNQFMLCPWAMSFFFFFKSCALPPSLLFYALFLGPVWAHNVASTIFWRDNQKITGPWERNPV